MPKLYNHCFAFAFDVITQNKPEDVAGFELKAALLARISDMPLVEVREACSCFEEDMGEGREDDEGPTVGPRPDWYS